jgi:hypothetical protein
MPIDSCRKWITDSIFPTNKDCVEGLVFEEIDAYRLPISLKIQATFASDSVFYSIDLLYVDHRCTEGNSICRTFNNSKPIALSQSVHLLVESFVPKSFASGRDMASAKLVESKMTSQTRGVGEMHWFSIEEWVWVESIHFLKKQNLVNDICILLSRFWARIRNDSNTDLFIDNDSTWRSCLSCVVEYNVCQSDQEFVTRRVDFRHMHLWRKIEHHIIILNYIWGILLGHWTLVTEHYIIGAHKCLSPRNIKDIARSVLQSWSSTV